MDPSHPWNTHRVEIMTRHADPVKTIAIRSRRATVGATNACGTPERKFVRDDNKKLCYIAPVLDAKLTLTAVTDNLKTCELPDSGMTEESVNLDVSDVQVTDEDGFLPYGMMIIAKDTIMKEQNWINVPFGKKKEDRAKTEQAYRQRGCVSASAARHWRSVARGARDCMREEASLRPEFYQRDVTDECCHPGSFLLMWCQRAFRTWSKLCRNQRLQHSLLLGEFSLVCMEDLDHGALWRALFTRSGSEKHTRRTD